MASAATLTASIDPAQCDAPAHEAATALVTGANKGIGKEIARGLAKTGMYTVIIGCRDPERGEQAAEELSSDTGYEVKFVKLDITQHESISKVVTLFNEAYQGRLHLLVNNAGFAFKGDTWGGDEAKKTLDVNFRGTKHMTQAMLPLLRKTKGIVINVASSSGYLSQVSKEIQSTLTSTELTQETIEDLAEDFEESVRSGQHSARGWSGSMYGVSKLLEIASTRVHASQEASNGVAIYCMCPGYCITDMTSGRGNKTATEGAETALYLAAGHGMQGSLPTGGFYADCKLKKW